MRLIDADRMKENLAVDINNNSVRFSDLTDKDYEKLNQETKIKLKILLDWVDAQRTVDIGRDPIRIWIERIEYIKELLMKFGTVEAEMVSQEDADTALEYLNQVETVLNYVSY